MKNYIKVVSSVFSLESYSKVSTPNILYCSKVTDKTPIKGIWNKGQSPLFDWKFKENKYRNGLK